MFKGFLVAGGIIVLTCIASSIYFISHTSYSNKTPLPTKTIEIPTDTPTPAINSQEDNSTWGQTTETSPGTYTTKISNDAVMATPQEIFQALNNYRQIHGIPTLNWSDSLANYAQSRAITCPQDGQGGHPHAGLADYLDNHNGKQQLGFGAVGENCAWGYTLSGVHLIEWVYAGDTDHNAVQLDTEFQYVGIAVSGTNNELLFGGSKY